MFDPKEQVMLSMELLDMARGPAPTEALRALSEKALLSLEEFFNGELEYFRGQLKGRVDEPHSEQMAKGLAGVAVSNLVEKMIKVQLPPLPKPKG